MKNKNILRAILPDIFVLLMGFSMKSQNFTYTNLTPCDVLIGYEVHAGTIPNCSTCGSGTYLCPGGTSGGSSAWCGSADLCVWFLDIDGCPYVNDVSTGNHISSGCHPGILNNYSVIVCPNASPTCAGQPVTITVNIMNVTIQ